MKPWRWMALALALSAALGCGSSEPAEDGGQEPVKQDGEQEPAEPEPEPIVFAESYAGTWSRDDGISYAVEDDGQTVRGELAEDPSGRFEAVSFELSRAESGLEGQASLAMADGAATVRWSLQPAGEGLDLVGKVQTVWLDPDGGLLTFDSNPEWAEHRFTVVAPEPEPEPEPYP